MDRLHELFSTGDDGILRRRVHIGTGAVGGTAGTDHGRGYLRVQIDRRLYYVHRVVFALTHGRWPTEHIDHVNGVRNDNRPSNLREANRCENARNARMPKTNTSGVKGVCWNKRKRKWSADIKVGGQTKRLGFFADIGMAALAYAEAAERFHGAFARTDQGVPPTAGARP